MKYALLLLSLFVVSSCEFLQKPAQMVGWGDSMMKGSGGELSILEVISDELDITSKNFGVGGLQSQNIAVLQGGIPFKMIFDKDQSLSSGESAIIWYNIEPINFQTEQYREGSIKEIQGKIKRLSHKTDKKNTIGYSFIPDNLKENIKFQDTVHFVFQDAQSHRNKFTIIWAGRNDKKSDDLIYKTRDHIKAMYNHLGEEAKNHCLILSVCNGIADLEGTGSNAHKNIIRLNTVLEASFPNQFIDVRSYMVHQAIYDMGIEPTKQDLEDISKDAIPRRFLSDNVHFNSLGYEATGKYLARIINERGWIAQKE